MNHCQFCTLSELDKSAIIWEGKWWYAKLDRTPVSPGHTLLILKRHNLNIKNLALEEWSELFCGIKNIHKVLKKTNIKKKYELFLKEKNAGLPCHYLEMALIHPCLESTPDAFNHGVNDGRAAGRTVDHFHWHVIPRFNNDQENPAGGVRCVLSNSQHNYL